MFITLGSPNYRLDDLRAEEDINQLKRAISVAVIDDNRFTFSDALRTHGFRIDELGGDIRGVDQIATYPVVVCDIKGVGSAFASEFEGAHVVSEIRKAFPDKYLIAFTGMTHSIKYNQLLANADQSMPKDASSDIWNESLTKALIEVGTPKRRWIRFRTHLSKNGIDAYQIFLLEQAFIEAAQTNDPSLMRRDRLISKMPSSARQMIVRFAETALATIALSQAGLS